MIDSESEMNENFEFRRTVRITCHPEEVGPTMNIA